MMSSFVSLIAFFFISPSLAGSEIRLDPAKLRSWNSGARLPCRGTFRAIYKKDGKEVTFLATRHFEAPVDLTSPEAETIRKEIASAAPSRMVVEMGSGGGFIPKEVAERIALPCFQGDRFTCSEDIYASWLASKQSIGVLGGEPPDAEIERLLKGKVSPEELLVQRSLRALISMREAGVVERDWPRRFNDFIREKPAHWSFESLDTWLKQNLAKNAVQVERSWIEPRADDGSSVTQKIFAAIEKAREPFILKQAERAINEAKKTLIIYGTSHFYKQAPAFETALGRPVIQCLEETVGPGRSDGSVKGSSTKTGSK